MSNEIPLYYSLGIPLLREGVKRKVVQVLIRTVIPVSMKAPKFIEIGWVDIVNINGQRTSTREHLKDIVLFGNYTEQV